MRELALRVLADHKAEDVLCLAAEGILDYTDYLLLATGRSRRHQLTMAEKLQLELKRATGTAPPLEGDRNASWLVLDCGGLIVHLQTRETREYYQLASLWFDASGPERENTPERAHERRALDA